MNQISGPIRITIENGYGSVSQALECLTSLLGTVENKCVERKVDQAHDEPSSSIIPLTFIHAGFLNFRSEMSRSIIQFSARFSFRVFLSSEHFRRKFLGQVDHKRESVVQWFQEILRVCLTQSFVIQLISVDFPFRTFHSSSKSSRIWFRASRCPSFPQMNFNFLVISPFRFRSRHSTLRHLHNSQFHLIALNWSSKSSRAELNYSISCVTTAAATSPVAKYANSAMQWNATFQWAIFSFSRNEYLMEYTASLKVNRESRKTRF